MALIKQQKICVETVLRNSLRKKLQNYNPEPASMPFHTRLLGKNRMALFSFIRQTAGTQISSESHRVIQNIMDGLSTANTLPNKPEEINAIRSVCRQGEMQNVKLTKVDIKLITHSGIVYLFDLKTAKPNVGGFKEFKRTLLEWVAATLASNPTVDVQSIIAIPYNPYEPRPYNRWTMRGMLDLDNELKVANEFWDFIGGEGAYQDLLNIFERIGIELRPEIDQRFQRFNKKT